MEGAPVWGPRGARSTGAGYPRLELACALAEGMKRKPKCFPLRSITCCEEIYHFASLLPPLWTRLGVSSQARSLRSVRSRQPPPGHRGVQRCCSASACWVPSELPARAPQDRCQETLASESGLASVGSAPGKQSKGSAAKAAQIKSRSGFN